MGSVKCVLLDIEGTVCPISFVKDTLFPYAIKALPHVLATQWDSVDFKTYRDAFPEEYRSSPEALQSHVEDLTRRDVKVAYLKNLQGYLWEEGYKSGAYATDLFPDVVPQLKAWKKQGLSLVIYSSGSVFAQKLLFAHVKRSGPEQGGSEDITSLFDDWFDTINAGLKVEAGSYTKIAKALNREPREILFLTDNVKEVDASVEAGLECLLVDRPGNAAVSEADRQRLRSIQSLDEVKL